MDITKEAIKRNRENLEEENIRKAQQLIGQIAEHSVRLRNCKKELAGLKCDDVDYESILK